ncbi:MAG: Gfo/Idh/MocA family protein [Solirubrobacteraceae bacterium]
MRVGLLGAGWIAESHVAHIQAADDADLVAVCDLDADRAGVVAGPAAAIYGDWEQMLERESLDALWVCTPPLHHRAPTIIALERGIHVYLEKPIARDLADGEAIVAAAESSHAVCAVGYMWRGTELLQRARESVALDHVAMLVSRNYGPVAGRGWFMDRAQSGGQILERASHHIDLQRAIAGDVTAVQASGATIPLAQFGAAGGTGLGIEDALAIVLHFASGAEGTISVAWTAPGQPHVHALDVLDHQATLSLRLGPGRFELHGHAGGAAIHGSYGDPMRRSVQRFLTAARRGDKTAVFCTPRDAQGTLKVAVSCEAALAGGNTVHVPV